MRWLFLTFSWIVAGSLAATAADRTIILDDGPDGAPAIPLVGTWNWRPESGDNAKPDSYLGTGSRFAFAGGDIETATYAPNFTYDGLWEASLWWPDFKWTNNALVQATHTGGSHDQRVNQSVNSGQWNPLGIYPFAEGPAGGSVVISSDGTDGGESNVGPVADAVRFQYLGELLTPATAYASSTNTTNTFRPPANVINRSGMSDTTGSGVPDTHEANQWGDDISWMAASGDLSGWFAVDLGDPYQLFRADVFNFNVEGGRTNRGVKLADVYVSTADAPTLGDFSDPGEWRLVAEDMSFSAASGTNSYNTPNPIDLDGRWARWFALDIQENHGGTFVGLSEIQFFGVPEPGTLLLCFLGLVCLLLPVRRRRRAVRAGLAGCFAFLLFGAGYVHAQTTYTWNGSADSLFTNSANWSSGIVALTGVTHAGRISVQNGGANPLIYTAAQGTTIYTGGASDRALFIGSGTAGSMIMTAGTFDGRGTNSDGMSANIDASLTLDGGNYINTNGGNNRFLVKYTGAGTGTLTINDGTFTVGALQYGDGSGSTGTGIVHLNGGLLSTHVVREGPGGTSNVDSTFNFNGGVLQARTNRSDFLQGLDDANVLGGGAVVDTQGFNVTVAQALLDGGGGGGLTKQGSGTLTLSGANTYTGATNVNQGILRITNSQALGGSAGGTSVANNGRLELSGGITVSGESLTIIGNGGNNFGAMQSESGDNTWTGNVLLAANGARIGANGAGRILRITGVIGDGPNSYTLGVRNADGGGTTILSGANTYGGTTDVVVGLLQIDGGDNRLPTGSVLRIGNSSNVASATFDLNGNNQQVAGLTSEGSSVSMDMTVTNSSATPATLTVNKTSGTDMYAGFLSGNLALTKTGAGTLELAGSGGNTYTGLTTVSDGALHLRKSDDLTAVAGDLDLSSGAKVTFGGTNQLGAGTNVTMSGGSSVFNGTGVNSGQANDTTQTLASLTVTGGAFQPGTSVWTITGAGVFDRSGSDNIYMVGNSSSTMSFGSLRLNNMTGTAGGNVATPNAFTLHGNSNAGITTLFVGSGGLTLDNSRLNLRRGGSSDRLGSRLVLDGDVTTTGTQPSFITEDTDGGTHGARDVELSSTAGNPTRTFTIGGGADLTVGVPITDGAASAGNIIKAGPGTLTLEGANTYTGLTTVEAGLLHVTGSLANGGSSHVQVASAGTAFGPNDPTVARRVAAGGGFAGLGSQSTGPGVLGTTADLRAGANNSGSPRNVAMAWRSFDSTDTAAFPPLTDLLSDVLRLEGMDDGTGQTDPFVLQMSYDAGLLQPYHDPPLLAWLSPTNGWRNAVEGNFAVGSGALAGFDGSWDTFEGTHGSDLDALLGSWGVDTAGQSAWAVLNHNSQFAVLAVPEPGTMLLGALGLLCLLMVRRRR